MAAQFRARVLRQRRPFSSAQVFELSLDFAQGWPEGANAEAHEDGLHLVHDPRLLGDKILPLAVRSPRVLLLDRRDGNHAAMALLATQPAEKGAHQEFGVEAIGLRAPVFARHRNARGMDDVSLDIAPQEPTREPEAVAASLIGDDDALNIASSPVRFIPPTLQQLQQGFLVGIELLKRLAFDAGNNRSNEPLGLAHLDHSDDRAILLEGGEGSARVNEKVLRHGGTPSVAVETAPKVPCPRRSPHSIFTAGDIESHLRRVRFAP